MTGSSRPSVAVVVPVHRTYRTPDEDISFRHLLRHLSRYDRYILAPEGLDVDYPGFGEKRFPARYFTGTNAYSELLLSPAFYSAFYNYEYILIYQLDCLVFRDDLEDWCAAAYDYIGAPLFRVTNKPSSGLSRVGNGGFSLRNVQASLRVLTSGKYVQDSVSILREMLRMRLQDVEEEYRLPYQWIKKLRVLRSVRQGVGAYTSRYTLNEDHFWMDRARLFEPGFRIAPLRVALGFSFECAPRYCYTQNDHQLPFGCHAWAKWDRAFWEPFLQL